MKNFIKQHAMKDRLENYDTPIKWKIVDRKGEMVRFMNEFWHELKTIGQ